MPYPSQVDHDQIVQAAHDIIEREGVEMLSLSKLAGQLGIKAPSLYRYFKNKETLLQAVNLLTLRQLFAQLESAVQLTPGDAISRLLAITQTYRRFAHAHSSLYILAMTSELDSIRPDENLLVQMILPIQAIVAEISDEVHSLTALRGLFALIHGFVMLELHGQLQRGGDLDKAYSDSVAAYLKGWAGT